MPCETENLKGRQFGELTVLKMHNRSPNGGASWECQCSCGKRCVAGGYQLLHRRKTNCGACNYERYFFKPNYVECHLPGGEIFQIDYEDYEMVSQYRWVTNRAGYFVASLGSRDENHIFLHRMIMKPSDGEVVDHIDGDIRNCRRENLRICSNTENSRNANLSRNNQSGFKGVYWAADRGKWRAEITVDRKHIHIGSFDSAVEAAQAYDSAAEKYFGAFAKTNEMLGNYEKVMCA